MINEKLMSTFRLIFHKTTQLRIVPLAYDAKANLWSVRNSKLGLLVSLLGTAIICFRLTFVVVALVTSDFNPENLHEDCLLALQLIVFFNGCGFHIAFWRRRSELVWLFNQTNSLNNGK